MESNKAMTATAAVDKCGATIIKCVFYGFNIFSPYGPILYFFFSFLFLQTGGSIGFIGVYSRVSLPLLLPCCSLANFRR